MKLRDEIAIEAESILENKFADFCSKCEDSEILEMTPSKLVSDFLAQAGLDMGLRIPTCA